MIEEIKKTEAGPDSARYIFMGMTHVVKKTDTKTLYYGVNHLDSTTLVTDETGKIVNELTDKTNPFGDQEEKGMFFTGKRWDEDAQLYYFNARWYDPDTGRFITEDPVKDSTLWYAYVSNNPLKYVDPEGLRARRQTEEEDEKPKEYYDYWKRKDEDEDQKKEREKQERILELEKEEKEQELLEKGTFINDLFSGVSGYIVENPEILPVLEKATGNGTLLGKISQGSSDLGILASGLTLIFSLFSEEENTSEVLYNTAKLGVSAVAKKTPGIGLASMYFEHTYGAAAKWAIETGSEFNSAMHQDPVGTLETFYQQFDNEFGFSYGK